MGMQVGLGNSRTAFCGGGRRRQSVACCAFTLELAMPANVVSG